MIGLCNFTLTEIVKLAAQIANLLLQKCGIYIKTLNTKCRTAINSVKNNFIKKWLSLYVLQKFSVIIRYLLHSSSWKKSKRSINWHFHIRQYSSLFCYHISVPYIGIRVCMKIKCTYIKCFLVIVTALSVVTVPLLFRLGKEWSKKLIHTRTYACNRKMNNTSELPYLKQVTSLYIYLLPLLVPKIQV
jgi:hypothetical protein